MRGIMWWLKNMALFDANVFLRYLLNDNAEMAVTLELFLSTERVQTT